MPTSGSGAYNQAISYVTNATGGTLRNPARRTQIINQAGATISATSIGVKFDHAATTLLNRGTIIGTGTDAIAFTAPRTGGVVGYLANELDVYAGSSIIGNVSGGGGRLALADNASIAGLGSSITNFSTLALFHQSVTAAGNIAGLGTMTIVGFAPQQTIDLTDFVAISQYYNR